MQIVSVDLVPSQPFGKSSRDRALTRPGNPHDDHDHALMLPSRQGIRQQLLRCGDGVPAIETCREAVTYPGGMAEVLVVDDDDTVASVVVNYLERAGHSARRSGDGSDALTIVTEHRPDLMVLDLMLPGLDGLE